MSKMRLLEKSAITIFLIILNNAIAFLINVFLARTMPTLEFGKLQTAYGFTALIFNFINLGIVFATNKHILHAKSQKNNVNSYIFNGFILMLIISAVFLTSCFIMLKPIMNLFDFNPALETVIQLTLVLVFFNLLYFFFSMSLIISGKTLKYSIIDVASIIFYALGSIILFFLSSMFVENVIIIRIISLAVPAIIIIFIIFRNAKAKISFSKMKEIIKTARISFITFISVILMSYVSKPIIGLISFEQVAYFSIAMNYGQIILIVASGIKTILLSIIGSLGVDKNLKKINTGLNIFSDVVLKIVLPLACILIILSKVTILFLYSETYTPAVILAVPIIIGAVINMLSINDSALFTGLDKLKDYNIYNLAKVIIYLPLLLFMIINLGAMGASLSYAALSIISLVAFLFFTRKYGIKMKLDKPLTLIIPLTMLYIFFVTNNFLLTSLLLILYVLLSVKFNIISADTKKTMITALKTRNLNKIAELIN
ncbi:hypothetical protein COS64_00410 [archaeon CG06_land_8_20_14_3_00_37_11]|nr:MAG: hypothetical protein COS64_00410 [archaeon CG06_land_8_20_14_3_00_37_11]